jgi:hypothetical protein
MKNLITIIISFFSFYVFSQSQRFEYDSINVHSNGIWLPRDIAMNSILILEEDKIREYSGESRFVFTIAKRFSREEMNLDEKLKLVISALVLDEKNKEYFLIITDQFASITDVTSQITIQYSK